MKSAAGIANIDIKEVTKFFRGLEFPALSSTNWITWKFRVGSCLRAEGLEALLHEDPILADVPLPILERWCSTDTVVSLVCIALQVPCERNGTQSTTP